MTASTATPCELSPDTQAVLLLCSGLGTSSDPAPLTPAEYNRLALWLKENNRRPCDLLAEGATGSLPKDVDLPPADRLRALLERGRLLALAVSRWSNFGIWILSRSDADYPERLRRLGHKAPPLLFGAGSFSLLHSGGLAIVGSRDVDEEALRFTHEVALRCAEQHLQVVSGGARGVDREALSTALETGGTILAIPVDRLLKVVTERAARSALHDQQLTVVTPYDPELGFTVGRAMGRNKYIYALADFALVVRFKTEEGGTWAGAVEQLRSNTTAPFRVSVFVRIKNNSETGWRKLQSLGALPFPEERLHDGAIPDLLSDVASSARDQVYAPAARSSHAPSSPADGAVASPPSIVTALPQQVVPPALTSAPPPDAPVVADPDSCYCRCLGLLLQELRQEPSKKQLTQIARRLELVPQQFNKWLQRALGEGKVLKKRKGGAIVYTDASIAEDSMLFGRTGDVAVPCESPAQSSDSRPPEPGE